MNKEFKDLSELNHSIDVAENSTTPKKIIKHNRYKIGTRKVISSEGKIKKPIIKVNKNGEVVQQIEIICKCGEKISLDLLYQ